MKRRHSNTGHNPNSVQPNPNNNNTVISRTSGRHPGKSFLNLSQSYKTVTKKKLNVDKILPTNPNIYDLNKNTHNNNNEIIYNSRQYHDHEVNDHYKTWHDINRENAYESSGYHNHNKSV